MTFPILNRDSDTIRDWAPKLNQGAIPSGSSVMWFTATAPSGWLLCDGTAVSRTTYADLFTAIGTTYGAGDGSTTFNVPDLKQRFPLGKAASGTGSCLASTGGAINHTHSVPAHKHSYTTTANQVIAGYRTNASGNRTAPAVGGTDFSDASIAIGNQAGVSGDSAMTSGSNNPPYLVVNFIIKT